MKRIKKNCLLGTAAEIGRVNRKLHAKNLYKIFVEEGLYPEKYYYLAIERGVVFMVEAFWY